MLVEMLALIGIRARSASPFADNIAMAARGADVPNTTWLGAGAVHRFPPAVRSRRGDPDDRRDRRGHADAAPPRRAPSTRIRRRRRAFGAGDRAADGEDGGGPADTAVAHGGDQAMTDVVTSLSLGHYLALGAIAVLQSASRASSSTART